MTADLICTRTLNINMYNTELDKGVRRLEVLNVFVTLHARYTDYDVDITNFDFLMKQKFIMFCLELHDKIVIPELYIEKQDEEFVYVKDGSKLRKDIVCINDVALYFESDIVNWFWHKFVNYFVKNQEEDESLNKCLKDINLEHIKFEIVVQNDNEDDVASITYPFGEVF